MNPEFQRNLYLEFSITRIVGMPAFLLVIFSLTYLIDDNTLGKVTVNTAIGLYIALVLFWGAKQAAESVFEELRNNTWDIQKTSAISPWSLTWGKLFGSTLFNWYGGLLCLLVYSIATPEPEYISLTWIYFLSAGLIAQSLSLLISLFSFRQQKSFNSGFSYLFALAILFFIIQIMFKIDEYDVDTLRWYGEEYNLIYFIASSLVIVCIWTIIGIYRLLAEELHIRTLPWVWITFLAFLCVFLTGFMPPNNKGVQQDILMDLIFVCLYVCIILSYLLLFSNENNPMLLRKLWVYYQQKQWLRVCQEMPCWMVNMLLVLPLVLVIMLIRTESIIDVRFSPLVIYLVVLRDIGIFLFFSYAPNPKRATMITLTYMICLYALLPAIFHRMNADVMVDIILPMFSKDLLLAILSAFIQASIVIFLLFQRWQSRVANVIN